MRHSILPLAIIIMTSTIALGQQQFVSSIESDETFHIKTSEVDIIAVPTPQRDTLFIPDDSIGKSLRWIWVNRPLENERPPVLVSCSNRVLLEKFSLYYGKKEKHKK